MQIEVKVKSDAPEENAKITLSNRWVHSELYDDKQLADVEAQLEDGGLQYTNSVAANAIWNTLNLDIQDKAWADEDNRALAEVKGALCVLGEAVMWSPRLSAIVNEMIDAGPHRATVPVWASEILTSILSPYADERSEACDYEASVLCNVLAGSSFEG